ncbi:MAG TPA: LacI family DNA-binding transcriptional regulator [Candidatus Dormibacteraeota bacterium]|nr:LacI family DNA-binding transcriptional regulator [Candidatus Dormibacteraeota bacterium]
MPSRVTIHDVALLAGVSVGTASKALNGRGQLRDETRERVQAAAQQLGFRPNDLARSLIRGRTFTVGLLTSDSFGRFSIPVMQGIEDALGAGSIAVYLCDARGDRVRERHYVNNLLARRVDGIIVSGRRADPRPSLGVDIPVPVVYAYSQSTSADDLAVVPDEAHGGRLAMEHLLRAGRRRLAHVTGPARFEAVRLRLEGARQALSQAGLSLPDERVLTGAWSEAWGREAAGLLLAEHPDVDAVFCGNDLIARGVADALRERGVRVPDDVAIVGYDNWEILATATRPPLTSVDMGLEGVGRTAAHLLLARIEGERDAGVRRLPCTLVVRESSGPVSFRDR